MVAFKVMLIVLCASQCALFIAAGILKMNIMRHMRELPDMPTKASP
jgi:hypothetical protein